MNFNINENLLSALDEYHERTMLMEKYVIEKMPYSGNLIDAVNDDLIYNVPIYDMGSRRYAAFCSFTEALWKKENDVKGNGYYFKDHKIINERDQFMLLYLFRLCGSGINYTPKKENGMFENEYPFLGTHGFGNFWIVNSVINKKYTWLEWKQDLIITDKPFTNNKGYLLPQFSFPGITNGHLLKYILEYSEDLVNEIFDFVSFDSKKDIYQVTDFGNSLLNKKGFKKQNFVLTAFAADLAEYFPERVNRNGLVYAGTNATKCIKLIFPKTNKKTSEFDYINEVLQFQSNRYGLTPIDCEDSRNCDPVRYFLEYQSPQHIQKNKGVIYKNNTNLKKKWSKEQYLNFISQLRK